MFRQRCMHTCIFMRSYLIRWISIFNSFLFLDYQRDEFFYFTGGNFLLKSNFQSETIHSDLNYFPYVYPKIHFLFKNSSKQPDNKRFWYKNWIQLRKLKISKHETKVKFSNYGRDDENKYWAIVNSYLSWLRHIKIKEKWLHTNDWIGCFWYVHELNRQRERDEKGRTRKCKW